MEEPPLFQNSEWCGRQDLNLHELPQQLLRLPRLPFRHSREDQNITHIDSQGKRYGHLEDVVVRKLDAVLFEEVANVVHQEPNGFSHLDSLQSAEVLQGEAGFSLQSDIHPL